MADEISIKISTSLRWNINDLLGPDAGILSQNVSPARFFADQATKDKYEEVIEVTIGTDVEILMPDLTSPGICMLQILDGGVGTSIIAFGPFITGAVVRFGQTSDVALFRLDTTTNNLGLETISGSDVNPLPVQVKVWSN